MSSEKNPSLRFVASSFIALAGVLLLAACGASTAAGSASASPTTPPSARPPSVMPPSVTPPSKSSTGDPSPTITTAPSEPLTPTGTGEATLDGPPTGTVWRDGTGPGSDLLAIAATHAFPAPSAIAGTVRIPNTQALNDYFTALSAGSDPELADKLRKQVAVVPPGKVLLAAEINRGCEIPQGAVVDAVGEKFVLTATGTLAGPIPDCVVANSTVAIVAVDPGEIPGGTTSPGSLVTLQQVQPTFPHIFGSVELTASSDGAQQFSSWGVKAPDVPAIPAGARRFAFLLTACPGDSADLRLTPTTINAQITQGESANCSAALQYLAIFDVNSTELGKAATLTAQQPDGAITATAFQQLDIASITGPRSMELTAAPAGLGAWGQNPPLPTLSDGSRRFAFLLFGCDDDWATLQLTDTTITAELGSKRPAGVFVTCSKAVVYLAVFDVGSTVVPASAVLTS
ncbi:hypothetical protein EH165_06365 [Nakamurella antarctica]|uniref:Uncharacterized protein n=1 Tax=Nakamurella antarctica TaxID=1902245 RepID=A0A3G8ZKV0_9ACTN|nr:hypothetical protein [Nakamurella antarctica]AZI57830.1 hypothetical protein EH165_06365 [Nakamurella antarctica]